MVKWLNGYTLFCNEHRPTLRDENEDKSAAEITSMLAKQWRALDEPSKQIYRNIAELNRVVRILLLRFKIYFINQFKQEYKKKKCVPRVKERDYDLFTFSITKTIRKPPASNTKKEKILDMSYFREAYSEFLIKKDERCLPQFMSVYDNQ